MLHKETGKLIEYADEMLSIVEREVGRSAEDVVTHLICTNARQAIANYLAGYLVGQKVEISPPVTMQGLLDQCKQLDPRFETIDLSPVHCRCKTHDNDYCLDLKQVNACMNVAQQARDIVMNSPPGY